MSIEMAKKRILARVPLESLIGERVKLTSRSGRKVGLCPFHNEKGPSFTIFDDHYFCFGCRARGDAIDFVRHDLGLSFMEALRHLAEKYGVDVPELEQNQADYRKSREISQHYRMLAAAQQFFVENLETRGEVTREYLVNRGFSPENIKDFGFGMSLDEPHALQRHLEKQGFSVKDMLSVSLASPSRQGKVYDFFQHRLMIPIRDRSGRVIAFGGRALGNDPAKYKNSRDNDLFHKSFTLFGIDRAREPIRAAGFAIVVEGYMDALQLWNHGFRNTVACLGTAFTADHMRVLSQITSRVHLMFDGDTAGQQASLRTVTQAIEIPQIAIKVVALPNRQDPDEYLRQNGAEALTKLIDGAQDLLDFAIQKEMAEAHALAIPELINQRFLPWLATVRDRMQRIFLIQRLSQLAGIPAEAIAEGLQEKKNQPASKPKAATPTLPTPNTYKARPLTALQYEILGHLYFAQPGELDLDALQQSLIAPLEWDNLWQEWALEMVAHHRDSLSPESKDAASWSVSAHEKFMDVVASLRKRKTAFAVTDRMGAITKLIQAVRRDAIRQSIKLLKSQLSQKDWSENPDENRQILGAITQLNQELIHLESSLNP